MFLLLKGDSKNSDNSENITTAIIFYSTVYRDKRG